MPNQPNLDGQVPQLVAQYIRSLFDSVNALQARLDAVEAVKVLDRGAAQKLYAPEVVTQALQSSGSAPLNVTNLQGRLAQPQAASIPEVLALPVLADPLSQDGGVVSYLETLYRFNASVEPGHWVIQGTAGKMLEDTRANRLANFPAGNEPLGVLFWETDTTYTYYVGLVAGVKTWLYAWGVWRRTQAQVAGVGFGTADARCRIYVTDYDHFLKWSGAAFGWDDGEQGSGMGPVYWEVDPTGVGWHLYNGATVSYLNADGTTSSVALPDLVTAPGQAAYLKAGGTPSGPNAAVAAVITGNTADAGAGSITGTISTPTLTMASYTPAGTVSAPAFTGGSNNTSLVSGGTPAGTVSAPTFTFVSDSATNNTFTVGGAVTAITTITNITGTISVPVFSGSTLATHQHTVTPTGTNSVPVFSGTPAVLTGTISTPTFTGGSLGVHHHAAGTLVNDATAEPRNLVRKPWFRI